MNSSEHEQPNRSPGANTNASSDVPLATILTGPTASGKTQLALDLAAEWSTRASGPQLEIINADSLILHRELNVGTAKPTAEELARVPHHLIDLISPAETFTAGEYLRACENKVGEIRKRGNVPLIVGGTAFYLKVLCFGLWDAPAADPALRAQLDQSDNDTLLRELHAIDNIAAERIGKHDRYRLIRALEIFKQSGKTPTEHETISRAERPTQPRYHLIVIDRDPGDLLKRIQKRTEMMLKSGLIEETENTLAMYGEVRPLQSVGYRQVLNFLAGKTIHGRRVRPGQAGLVDEINLATQQLVKKQRTFLRGIGKDVPHHWFTLERDRALAERTLREALKT